MPKLAGDIAKKAEEAHLEGPKQGPLVPEALYLGRLKEVTVSEKEGPSGYHYWNWDFSLEDEGEWKGVVKRFITSLAPGAEFAFGGAFAAFHRPADTDTDELLGQYAILNISQVPIPKGPQKGQMQNRVEGITAVDPEGEAALADAMGGGVKAGDF